MPTPVFSQKLRREVMAIESADGMNLNPVKGEVVQIFHTIYAVGIKALKEADTLIHIGLETVGMEGRR
ncbi:PTS glucose transporter subunit IIA [Halobacillus sp. B29]|uniref:PTS glucose transporter subunit IIA n=1 Tax=Halobacillus sp. B29 TaxID=3457432 RepID=UPI003FCDCEE9